MSVPRVFIDGQHGTTGLRISALLAARDDLELVQVDAARRKDAAARAEALRAADVAVLCLPDAAAAEALELAEGSDTRIIDTSSARRVAPGWVYGLPEMSRAQRDAIRRGNRVANPGCYPQSVILALRPLIESGRLRADNPYTVNAVSGYSGGGRQLVEDYRALPPADGDAGRGLCLYALDGGHKHLPEMQAYGGMRRAPLFVPSVDHRFCGMLVSVPLPAPWLDGLTRETVHAIWQERYAGEALVGVPSPRACDAALRGGRYLDLPDEGMGNRLDLMVFGDPRVGLVLVGRLDNLGKGAAGNAVQCLNLMLGLPESRGLLGRESAAA
jgi:N-acetyl-gamma-glutamyl-phosphate reductase